MAGFVARTPEVAVMRRWAEGLGAGPSALVIIGEAGIGKSTLWAEGVSLASTAGARVLRARPVRAELPLPFVALRDLFAGVEPDVMDQLPKPLRASFAAVVGLSAPTVGAAGVAGSAGSAGSVGPVDPQAAGRAVAEALTALAVDGPLVVAIDDEPWLDAPTRRALAFAVRRIVPAAVGFLVARRGTPDAAGDPLGLRAAWGERVEELPLGPLGLGPLIHLLRRRLGPDVPRRRLVAAAERSGGNPFAALELARAEPGVELPAALRSMVERPLRNAPADCRSAVELAAIVGRAPPELFVRALGVHAGRAIEEAAAVGLLVLEAGEVRFAHPLLAAGAYESIPLARRQRLHRLAATLVEDLEARAGHLAQAHVEPDAGAAALVEEAAARADARGAPESAAGLAASARRLTPAEAPEDAARRGVLMAEYHDRAGDASEARRLLDEILGGPIRGPVRARALRLRAVLSDEPVSAVARLEEAVCEAQDEPALRVGTLTELAWQRGMWLGDLTGAVPQAEEAVGLARAHGDPVLLADALVATGIMEGFRGSDRAATILREVIPLTERFPPGVTNARPPKEALGHVVMWRGELDEAAGLFAAELARVDALGLENTSLRMRMFEAEVELRRGDFDRSEALCDDVLLRATDYWRWRTLSQRAVVRAVRGEEDGARTDAEEALASPAGAHDAVLAATAEHALGLLDLGRGDARAAAARLAMLPERLAAASVGEPGMVPVLPDAVEAALAAGDRPLGERLTALLLPPRPGHRWSAAAGAHAEGLLLVADGDLEAGIARLEEAERRYAALPSAFPAARARLARGIALRRAGRRGQAAEALEAAAGAFEALGATPWAGRAQNEVHRARPRPRHDDSLTETERRVAALVAAGHTNREVAAQLVVTVATVETHLTRIYGKLGLRSRTELTRAAAEGDARLEG
ncbi:MAG TPA: LuxR C-terminal-related transcriptional regulator [Candidatus Limnocylindrales bacterium]|nr:LuxR C-terminal-related transcriptional regulator [Candidatus Limnocylindrales bacterium]